jgi:hypothetical protein
MFKLLDITLLACNYRSKPVLSLSFVFIIYYFYLGLSLGFLFYFLATFLYLKTMKL